MQIIIRIANMCFLLFTSGQCRIMGKGSLSNFIQLFYSIAHYISSYTITEPYIVSQTITRKLPHHYCPLNLHVLIRKFHLHKKVQFEPELFPAICVLKWEGCHVNPNPLQLETNVSGTPIYHSSAYTFQFY